MVTPLYFTYWFENKWSIYIVPRIVLEGDDVRTGWGVDNSSH